ncbi:hypothetical protein M422DRAFT_784111 [Sphaerobolus stellatus SS14]|uniref:Major facilitator superfamily (MFS) profile domain-containing protein n=1 Tax=Sphaerobolus stellatus (strain SS14) TaxID=990650 RepID=A0A0C9UXJ2_SPHS4|nr:hypothetical protein M422DRAFT_784111 [Sphaerobolus stellatus SS14]
MSFVFVIMFLRVKKPEGSVSDQLSRVDWFNLRHNPRNYWPYMGWQPIPMEFCSSPCTTHHWTFPHSGVYHYEAKVAKEPTIPWEIISNRVSFSGYWATMIYGMTSIAIIYYLPVYFQAALLSSPLRSAVQMLSTAVIIAPLAFVVGATVQVTKRYIPVNIIGWIITIVGLGVLSLLTATSDTAQWVGYQIIVSAGVGMLFTSTVFPILAPHPVNRSASALAFFSFIRSFAKAWGITLSSTVLQNQLKKNLPRSLPVSVPRRSPNCLCRYSTY